MTVINIEIPESIAEFLERTRPKDVLFSKWVGRMFEIFIFKKYGFEPLVPWTKEIKNNVNNKVNNKQINEHLDSIHKDFGT